MTKVLEFNPNCNITQVHDLQEFVSQLFSSTFFNKPCRILVNAYKESYTPTHTVDDTTTGIIIYFKVWFKEDIFTNEELWKWTSMRSVEGKYFNSVIEHADQEF